MAYDVGHRISHSVSGVTAAGNVIIDAHTKYGAWSKEAGIIEADITEVKTQIKAVSDVEKVQDDSMYVRKAKTMDKKHCNGRLRMRYRGCRRWEAAISVKTQP